MQRIVTWHSVQGHVSSRTYIHYGIFTVLTFDSIYAIFGILSVLAFGNIHDFGNVHAAFGVLANFFGVLAVLDLSIFVPLIQHCKVWFVASCEQQHELLIVAWGSVLSFLAFVCCCHRSSRYDNKK
jgi:hypothetical protein